MAKNAQIVLIGTNHKKAPVEIREKLSLHGQNPYNIFNSQLCEEVLFVSTCNRVELLTFTMQLESAIPYIKETWSLHSGLTVKELDTYLYTYTDKDAISHLFKVASSLDSMVVGEPQILGQIKDAYENACNHGRVGPILNRLLNKTFSVAKLIRTETGIATSAVSISYAAVELARKIFGDLKDKEVLLIGAGEMAELAAKHLKSNGIKKLIVANRTIERAVEIAQKLNGKAISLSEIIDALCYVDIVISSTGAPNFIITYDDIKKIMRPRRHKLLFLIDIAVPRDIDPQVNKIENVYLYDIDSLKDVVENNLLKREKEAKKAERIVEVEVIKFLNWLSTLEVVPVIKQIQKKVEEIRQKELEKTLSKLKGLNQEQIHAIEVLTKSISQKIINDPILAIKDTKCEEDRKELLSLTQKLFKLDIKLD